MPNKKDLERLFGISDNTVYKTLKACGLDTAREDYADEEIENFFRVAREMIASGKKYKDVERHFGVGHSDSPGAEREHSASHPSAADAVGVATAELAVDLVQDAVKKISPHIPDLIAHSLVQEMRSPEMKSAFEDMRNQMREQASSSSNAGVDFLLHKMNGTRQLTGEGLNQEQLPSALPTESESS